MHLNIHGIDSSRDVFCLIDLFTKKNWKKLNKFKEENKIAELWREIILFDIFITMNVKRKICVISY
jgi:hypothetical protein